MEAVRVEAEVVTDSGRYTVELVGKDDHRPEVLLRDVPDTLLESFFDENFRPSPTTIEAECFDGGVTQFFATDISNDTDTPTFTLSGEFDPADAQIAHPWRGDHRPQEK